jgi:hypothetical protein
MRQDTVIEPRYNPRTSEIKKFVYNNYYYWKHSFKILTGTYYGNFALASARSAAKILPQSWKQTTRHQ